MYTTRSGLTLGFHGTDLRVVDKVVAETQEFRYRENSWDWLGHGAYFWENSPSRALEFAESARKRVSSSIKEPAVLGAVIDLMHCLDLLDYNNLSMVKEAYGVLLETYGLSSYECLRNRGSKSGNIEDLLLRDLDRAVIETVHLINRRAGNRPFDSVRGVFWEGDLIYPTAGFREKDHIQICIRNPNCIKGFFVPRKQIEYIDHGPENPVVGPGVLFTQIAEVIDRREYDQRLLDMDIFLEGTG